MTNAEIAAQLTEALEAAATEVAGAPTALVSVEVTVLTPGAGGTPIVHLTRKTRTLAFMRAEYLGASGAKVAIASSVHKVLGG